VSQSWPVKLTWRHRSRVYSIHTMWLHIGALMILSLPSDVSPWPWPWPWDCGLDLGLTGLALAKNSRPKSWRTTMFPMNFHRLEWIIFQDPRSLLKYLVTVPTLVILLISTYHCQWWVMLLNCACILVRVLEKTGFHYFIFHRNPLHWDGHGLGLGLECSGLVNITVSS